MTMKWTATAMRLVLAAIFLAHGISKLNSGMDLMADWFSSVGLPGFLAYMVAMLELVCGTLIGLGVLTRSAAIGFIVVMIGAIVTVKLPAGLLGNAGSPGYELDLALMALAAYFAASKEIGFGLDSLFAERDRREEERFNASVAIPAPAAVPGHAVSGAASRPAIHPIATERGGAEPIAAAGNFQTAGLLRTSSNAGATEPIAAAGKFRAARLLHASPDTGSGPEAPTSNDAIAPDQRASAAAGLGTAYSTPSPSESVKHRPILI